MNLVQYEISDRNSIQVEVGDKPCYEFKLEAAVLGPGADIILQTKSVVPTEETQAIDPDAGYNALARVFVNNIPIKYGNAEDKTATANQLIAGYTAIGWDEENSRAIELSGAITEKAAQTYGVSVNDQVINSGQYISGTQTIKGVLTQNISADNIKYGTTVSIGDSNNPSRILEITGTLDYIAEVNSIPSSKITTIIHNTSNDNFYIWRN